MYYAMLIGASFLFGSQFMVTKAFEKNYGKTVRASLSFSLLYSLFAGVIFFIIKLVSSGTVFNLNSFSLCMAFGLSLVNILSSAIGIKTLALGDIAVYSLFLMLGGMIVPFFAGIVFLKESVSVCNLIGVAIMIIALCLPVFFGKQNKNAGEAQTDGDTKKKTSVFFYVLCVFLFILNGLSSTLSKFNSVREGSALGAEFTFYTYGIQFVISLAAFALTTALGKSDKMQNEEKQPVILFRPVAIGCGAAFGAVNGTAFLMSSVAAEHVVAVAQYPLITGATILFSSLLAFLFYREKPTALQLVQIVISLAATILFMF
jgi:drug/metabolite transporter (DMT)-like permease